MYFCGKMPDNKAEMRLIAVIMIVAGVTSAATGAPAAAAGPVSLRQQGPATGTLAGTARGPQSEALAHHTIRVRSLTDGHVVASAPSDLAGRFSFVLNTGDYMVDVVNAANEVVATSAAINVVGGATVTVTLTASASTALGVAAAGGAGAGAAAGGAGVAAAGATISTAVLVSTFATFAGIVGVVVAVNRGPVSPSR
jgi:methionine-rich copper-binding protein CopC